MIFFCSSTCSCADKWDDWASKDEAKRQATDHETNKKSVSVPFHGGNCSSKRKHDISGKYYTSRGSKSVERGFSHINTAVTVPQRKEEMSKDSRYEKSSQRSSYTLKKQLMSPSLVSDEQKAQAQYVLNRRCSAEKPQRTGKDSSTIKTREPSKTSCISKDSVCQKKREVAKQKCQQHQENKFKATRTLSTEAKTPYSSNRKQSSSSGKHRTSVSGSHAAKNITSVPEDVKLVSHKTAKPSSAHQKICSVASPLPSDFRIPKIVQPRPVDCTGEANDGITTTRNVQHETELSKSGPTVSSSKQGAVQQAHSCLDVARSFSSEGQDERSPSSGRLPATLNAVTEPWYDQVMKSIISF